MTVEFIPHIFDATTNFPKGQRGWYAYYRVGADSVNDGAFRMLDVARSEEHTSELQSLMRISYAVFCLKKKKQNHESTNLLRNADNTTQHPIPSRSYLQN